MHQTAHTLAFASVGPARYRDAGKPSLWQQFMDRLLAWQRPSTKLVLQRLDAYLPRD